MGKGRRYGRSARGGIPRSDISGENHAYQSVGGNGLAHVRGGSNSGKSGREAKAGFFSAGIHSQRERRQYHLPSGASGELSVRRLQGISVEWQPRYRKTNSYRGPNRRRARTTF